MTNDPYAQARISSAELTSAIRAFARAQGIRDVDELDQHELLLCFNGRWRVGIPTEFESVPFNAQTWIALRGAEGLSGTTFGDGGTCALTLPIPAPVTEVGANMGTPLPELNDYYSITLPAGSFTNGAVLHGQIVGRFIATLITGRNDSLGTADRTCVSFSLDPYSRSVLRDERTNEKLVGSVVPCMVGWDPETGPNIGTASDDTYAMLVTHTVRHNLATDDQRFFAVPREETLSLPPDLSVGEFYYIDASYPINITSDGTTTLTSAGFAALSVGDKITVAALLNNSVAHTLPSGITVSTDYEILTKPTATTATICTVPDATTTSSAITVGSGAFVAEIFPSFTYHVSRLASGLSTSVGEWIDTEKSITDPIFADAEVGNWVQLADSTTSGLTAGLYEITALAGNKATFSGMPTAASGASADDLVCVLYPHVLYNVAVPATEGTELVATQASFGSMHQMEWLFQFSNSDVSADARYFKIEFYGFADGTTSGDEKGAIWMAKMEVLPYAEALTLASGDGTHRLAVTAGATLTRGFATISRTRPGNSANINDQNSVEVAEGAPLVRAKSIYYTDSLAVTFTAATGLAAGDTLEHVDFEYLRPDDPIVITDAGTTGLSLTTYFVREKISDTTITIKATSGYGAGIVAFSDGSVNGTFGTLPYNAYQSTAWDYGGKYDIVTIDRNLTAKSANQGSTIVMTDARWHATNRVLLKASAFTALEWEPGLRIYISSWGDAAGGTAGYYEIEKKIANNRIRLVAGQPGLATSNTSTDSVDGEIEEYPLASVLGEDSGSGGSPATTSVLLRGATVIGDIVYHDNTLRELHVRLKDPAVHVVYGDTLTINVYRSERNNGTGAFGIGSNSTTPVRTYTVTAKRVDVGPHATNLTMRVGVDGIQDGAVELEVRSGYVELLRHRSR